MYKIICNNIIVDVVKEARYVRYIADHNRVVLTDKSNAEAFVGSDNKTFYKLQGVKAPAAKPHWQSAQLVKITEADYNYLKKQLNEKQIIYENKQALNLVRSEKIEELKKICSDKICNGITVVFSDNKEHHFRLTIEDQLNLMSIEADIRNGATTVLYHETDSVCKLYSSKDIELLIKEANKHKSYHTTYFNLLKYCINNMYNTDEIKSIQYGNNLFALNVSKSILDVVKEKMYG